jgi:hypothetical protein
MQVYQSPYLTLEVVPENQLIKVIWSPETITMTDDIFKSELTKYAEIAEQYHPHFSLVDTSAFAMTLVPEIQEWVQENIHPRSLKASIQKFAYLVSQDFFSQVSIEQTMEESGIMFTTQYFDNQQDALNWLLSK